MTFKSARLTDRICVRVISKLQYSKVRSYYSVIPTVMVSCLDTLWHHNILSLIDTVFIYERVATSDSWHTKILYK